MRVDEPIIKDRYEVVVIGAGMGGLVAASVLAHEGIEVLVVEQSHRPGGSMSSFRLGDFTFDAAASIFQGFGELGFNVQRRVFDYLNQQVELVPLDSAYRLYFDEHSIEMHNDRNVFTAELGAIFPEQAGSILSFMRELDHLYHSVLDCAGPIRPSADESLSARLWLLARYPMSMVRMSRYTRKSAGRIFSRHVGDPLAFAFFNADAFYNTGYFLDELSSPYLSLVMMDKFSGGSHYPISSSQQIPNRLEKSVVEDGGRFAYRNRVEEITVENGQATGVRLEDGKTIRAEAVVSDQPVGELFGRMVDREHLGPQILEWVKSLKQAPGQLAMYLGVPESLIPDDMHPNTVIVEKPEREPGRFISINIPSMLDPNLAPQGHHSVCIRSVTDPGLWPRPWSPDYGLGEYLQHKKSQSETLLGVVEGFIPGIRSSEVSSCIASPTTFERYTVRPGGALSGPRPEEGLYPSSLPGAVTEIRGLFLVGDSTIFGRGVANAAASGINGSAAVMRHLGLRSPRFHPVAESLALETVPVRPEISGEAVVDSLSAVLESHRCLGCEDAPCRSACPARVDIPSFIRRIGASDIVGAARTIRDYNPLGKACGILCPVELLCQGHCQRSEIDTPVKIGQLEEFACSHANVPEGWSSYPPDYSGKRVAVIGSGPAGISCAFYLWLLGHSVEVIESESDAGGLPSRAMPEFRLGHHVYLREIEGATMSGIGFRGNTVFGEDINFESLWREGFQAIFLGTGLGKDRMPDIKGVDLPGVIEAIAFLTSARRGVKRELASGVVVLGDDNIAMDVARLALKLGAERVFAVTRSKEHELKATPIRVESAREEGVEILSERIAWEIVGEGRVQGLRTRNANSAPGKSGKEDEEVRFVEAGTVIVSGERETDSTLAQYLSGHLKMNPDGSVWVDHYKLMTSRPGIFAGGEVTGECHLVVEACAHGRMAALSIDSYLKSESPQPPSRPASSS